jgi:hypothetical protein
MCNLVWTTHASLKFQINRVDVFASNCANKSPKVSANSHFHIQFDLNEIEAIHRITGSA